MPSLKLYTRLNSQNRIKLTLLMNSDTVICIWILVFPIGIIEDSTPRSWIFWLHFSFLQDYWPPTTLNPLVHTLWGEMYRCEIRGFWAPQNAKKENQLKHKNQVRNILFIDSYVFEDEGLYLSLRVEHIKDKCLHLLQ